MAVLIVVLLVQVFVCTDPAFSKSKAGKSKVTKVLVLQERSRTGGGTREIVIHDFRYGKITNNWYSASVLPGPRYYVWNDDSRVYAEYNKLPLEQINSFRKLSKRMNHEGPNNLWSDNASEKDKGSQLKQKRLSSKVFLGKGKFLNSFVDKYLTTYWGLDKKKHLVEVWTLKEVDYKSPIAQLYNALFFSPLGKGIPVKVVTGKPSLPRQKRMILSSVTKLEKKRLNKTSYFDKKNYKRVTDLYTVMMGSQRSELELLFRNH